MWSKVSSRQWNCSTRSSTLIAKQSLPEVHSNSASRLNQEQWNLAKVNIQRDELQSVLQRNRRDPDIIARNGPALLSQIHVIFNESEAPQLCSLHLLDRLLT